MSDIEQIEKLITDTEALPDGDMKAVKAVQMYAEMVIRNVFGDTSHYLRDLWGIEFWPSTPASSSIHRFEPNKAQNDAAWRAGVASMKNLFQVMLAERKLFPKSIKDDPAAKLSAIKAKLDQRAERAAKCCLLLISMLLFLLWSSSVFVVLFASWSDVEPWIWYADTGITVLSFGYFAITQRSLSPEAIYKGIVEARRKRLYRDFGLDWPS